VTSRRAARSYAKALHDLARAAGRTETIAAELASVVEVVRGDAALEQLFTRPGVSAATKHGVADEIAQRLDVSKLVRDFLGLVAGHGRAALLPDIAEAYRMLVDADANRARVRVRTAVPLNEQERTLLAARNRGLKFLHMACLADNKRMQQLARKYVAELSFDFSNVVGEVSAPRPTPLSLMREILADGHGFATAMFDVQSRLLKPV